LQRYSTEIVFGEKIMNLKINKILRKLLLNCSVFVISFGIVCSQQAHAADGAPDIGFAGTGKTLTSFPYGMAIGSTVVVQPDGKAVVAGLVGDQNFEPIWGIVRYNVDGTLDQTFGTGGKATVDFKSYYTWKVDIKLQSDGKILLGGAVAPLFQNVDFGIARLNTDGTLDQTFGNGGTMAYDMSGIGYPDGIMGLAVQSDGKIVAAGYAVDHPGYFDFGVLRVNPNGSIDSTFGTGGKVMVDFQDMEDLGADVAIQSDGKIVVVGTSATPNFERDFAAIRLSANGTLDATFGAGGKTTVSFDQYDEGNAVGIQTDGKIVIGGSAGAGSVATSNFGLTRLNTDGSIDTSFGVNGRTTTDFFTGLDHINDLLIQPDGKIVAAGDVTSDISNVELYVDYGIARYDTNGALDSTFGASGKVNTDFGNADYGWGIALGPDCKLVASGFSWQLVTGGDLNYGVARYDSSGCVVQPPPTGSTCPKTHGYWKTHPESWPVDSLVLGSQTYNKNELLTLLGLTSNTDASITLARQLIAAKLNIASGSDPAPVASAITASDALLSQYTGKLPYKVKSSSTNGQTMATNATILTNYNQGLLTPTCTP
jgi:uncharacterized delta-60 repeat protein